MSHTPWQPAQKVMATHLSHARFAAAKKLKKSGSTEETQINTINKSIFN